MLTCTTISDIRFYSFKETAGNVIDLSFELVNILPGKFPKTRDSIQKELSLCRFRSHLRVLL